MNQQNSGWQLEITPKGRIFVTHFEKPKFKVELVPKDKSSEMEFSFVGAWEDHPDNAMHWYMKALEFYRFAIKQPDFRGLVLQLRHYQTSHPVRRISSTLHLA